LFGYGRKEGCPKGTSTDVSEASAHTTHKPLEVRPRTARFDLRHAYVNNYSECLQSPDPAIAASFRSHALAVEIKTARHAATGAQQTSCRVHKVYLTRANSDSCRTSHRDMALVFHAQTSYELSQYRSPLAHWRTRAVEWLRFCQISSRGTG
jgi:hypothetical protein